MSLTPVGDMGIAMKANVDDFHKGMRTSRESVGLLTGSIAGLSAAARNLGIVITGAAALGGAGLLTLSRRAERVNEAFREVGTITSEVEDVQGEYADLVSELNTEFGLQAGRLEIIEGLYQSISAGVAESEEAQRDFLTTAAQLAVVGRVDLATSVDVLSTSMNAYGEGTEFAERASEALFRTVQFGKVTLEELAPVMGRITALSSELSIEIEEVGAGMAVLTRTGFEARVAATGLRDVLRQLMQPSDELQSALADIAAENDFFASSMGENEDLARNLAEEYRRLTDSLSELDAAQSQARRSQEEHSLAIQEARLVQSAIEQDRMDEIGELRELELDLNDLRGSQEQQIEQLNDAIEEHRFQLNQSRVEEEQYRLEIEDQEEALESVLEDFSTKLDTAGNLEEGIGMLVSENMELVEILQELERITEETDTSMAELIPRQRGLQAALALTGDSSEMLQQIFETMREDGVEAASEELEEHRDELELTDEEYENLQDDLKEMPELFEDMTGPAQEMRNAMSQIRETFEDIGQVFVDDTIGLLHDISELFGSVADRVEELDEEIRSSISRFAMLGISIGLVLGPLLLLGGQMGLIASSMGVGLIPFLGATGLLFGTLAAAMNMALSSGEESEAMFDAMGGTFDTLVDVLRNARDAFLIALQGMEAAGLAFIGLIQGIKGEMDDFLDDEDTINPLQQFATFVNLAFASLANFIDQNEEAITALILLGADVLVNTVIPAIEQFAEDILPIALDVLSDLGELLINDLIPDFIAFAQEALDGSMDALTAFVAGLIEVIGAMIAFAESDDGRALLSALGAALLVTSQAVILLVESIGEFMQSNSEWLGQLAALALVFAAVAIPAIKLVGILSPLIAGLTSLFATAKMGIFVLGMLATHVSMVAAMKVALIGIIGALGGPITVLIGLIALLAAAWTMNVFGIRDATMEVVRIIQDSFAAVTEDIQATVAVWRNIFETFWDFFGGIFEAGFDMWIALFQNTFESILSIVGIFVDANIQNLSSLIQIATSMIRFWLALFRGDISGALGEVIAIFGHFRDILVTTFGGMTDILKEILVGWIGSALDIVTDGLTNIAIQAYQSALQIPEMIAAGIRAGLDSVREEMNEIASIVTDHLPSSPAQTGPLADQPPRESGEAVSSGIAEGIAANADEVEEASFDLAKTVDDEEFDFDTDFDTEEFEFEAFDAEEFDIGEFESEEFDIESDLDIHGDESGFSHTGDDEFRQEKKKVIVQEGAFQAIIESGAFEGVSEEELPEKVGDEVEMRFQEIVDRVDGTGHGQ